MLFLPLSFSSHAAVIRRPSHSVRVQSETTRTTHTNSADVREAGKSSELPSRAVVRQLVPARDVDFVVLSMLQK